MKNRCRIGPGGMQTMTNFCVNQSHASSEQVYISRKWLEKMLKWLKTRLILNLKLNLTLGRMMEVGGCQPRPIFTQLKKEV